MDHKKTRSSRKRHIKAKFSKTQRNLTKSHLESLKNAIQHYFKNRSATSSARSSETYSKRHRDLENEFARDIERAENTIKDIIQNDLYDEYKDSVLQELENKCQDKSLLLAFSTYVKENQRAKQLEELLDNKHEFNGNDYYTKVQEYKQSAYCDQIKLKTYENLLSNAIVSAEAKELFHQIEKQDPTPGLIGEKLLKTNIETLQQLKRKLKDIDSDDAIILSLMIDTQINICKEHLAFLQTVLKTKNPSDWKKLEDELKKFTSSKRYNSNLACGAQLRLNKLKERNVDQQLEQLQLIIKNKQNKFDQSTLMQLKTIKKDILEIKDLKDIPIDKRLYLIIVEYLQGYQEEVDLQTQPIRPTNHSESTSNTDSNEVVNQLKTINSSKQDIRNLLENQPTGNSIPVIMTSVHGGVSYNPDTNKCETVECPLQVVFRYLVSAPGEVNTDILDNPEFLPLKNNSTIHNPQSTVKQIFEEIKQKYASTQDKTYKPFVKVIDGIMTNFNKSDRNHFLINYKGSKMCDKYFQKHNGIHHGIWVLNNTEAINKDGEKATLRENTNLWIDEKFKAFIETKDNCVTDERGLKEVQAFELYNYLAHLGYKQAIIIDTSCEVNVEKGTLTKRLHLNDILLVQSFMNLDEEAAEILLEIMAQNWGFRQHLEQTQIHAKQKSRKHAFSVLSKSANHWR
jgi:hypothetical protein